MQRGRGAIRLAVALAPLVLLMALLAACGGDDGRQTPAETPVWPQGDWKLEYSRNGGIAGMNQRLMLDSKGHVTTEDGRTGRNGAGYAVPSDVAMITALLRGLNLPALKSDQGFPVPDAIITSLKVTSGDRSYGATFNKEPDSVEARSLFRRLAALYDASKP
jgi:hypothetical protein